MAEKKDVEKKKWESPWSKTGLAHVAGARLADALAAPLYLFDPFKALFRDQEEPLYYESKSKESVKAESPLTVMTWNVKFGGARLDFWFDGHGDRVLMSADEVKKNLEAVAEKINQVDPDILFIQELDRRSKRVAGIDQVQFLLDRTQLNYGVYASQWRSKLIPVDGIGAVDMGNAIFSKHRIEDGLRLSLPEMKIQDRLTRYFYLKRNILTARVKVEGWEDLHVVNSHAAAFAQDDTKRRHLEELKAELDRIDENGGIFVVGADLNSLPPDTSQRSGFCDVHGGKGAKMAADYRGEEELLRPFYEDYHPAISLEEYRADNGPHFTHSTSGKHFWNRKLDYLFSNRNFVKGSAMTHQNKKRGGMETMHRSDHAPISAQLNLERQR